MQVTGLGDRRKSLQHCGHHRGFPALAEHRRALQQVGFRGVDEMLVQRRKVATPSRPGPDLGAKGRTGSYYEAQALIEIPTLILS